MKLKLLLCIVLFLFLIPLVAKVYFAGSSPKAVPEIVTIDVVQKIQVDPYSTSSIRSYILTQFPDAPVMANIASCESQFRQLNKDGSALRGFQNNLDVGVFMVNEYYHKKEATSLGLNLEKLEDNVAFARVLYDRNGTRDWNWSKYPIGKFKGWAQGECS